MSRDPKDTGTPVMKEWEEFRAAFSGVLLFFWLLRDLSDVAPDYAYRLALRLDEGRDIGAALWPEDEETVPIPSYDDDPDKLDFWETSRFEQLGKQLFPHGISEADRDFRFTCLGLVTAGLYSAFESYCKACNIYKRGSLEKAIRRWFKSREVGALISADVGDVLRELEATRHVYVHNRGIVDDRYIERVPDVHRVRGELRTLKGREVQEFIDVTWWVARQIAVVRIVTEAGG